MYLQKRDADRATIVARSDGAMVVDVPSLPMFTITRKAAIELAAKLVAGAAECDENYQHEGL